MKEIASLKVKTHGAHLPPPENSGGSAAIPVTSSAAAAEGLGTARFSPPLDLKKHPKRHDGSAGAAPCPKTTTPAS